MKIHATARAAHAECVQEDAIADLRAKTAKLDKAVFFGNGTPPVITQLATLTQSVSALTKLAWITLAAVITQLIYLAFDKLAK